MGAAGSTPCGRHRLRGYSAALCIGSVPGGCPSGPTNRSSRICSQWFRCRCCCANPASIVYFSPYRGFPRRGHLPSPGLVVVAVRLPILGHAVAAADAAAADARRPIFQSHPPSSRPSGVREWGTIRSHRSHRSQPQPKHASHHLPPSLFSLVHRTWYVARTLSSIMVRVRLGAYCRIFLSTS